MAKPRQTRAEKKAALREQLLVAAERIAKREGFTRMSLDRVADAAGVTKGAIYSNFASRVELLEEVASRLTGSLNLDVGAARARTPAGLLDYVADSMIEVLHSRSREPLLALEFMVLAIRDPQLRRAARAAESPVDELDPEDPIVAWIEANEAVLPRPPEEWFQAVNAVANGLIMRRVLFGERVVSDELIRWTLARLL